MSFVLPNGGEEDPACEIWECDLENCTLVYERFDHEGKVWLWWCDLP